MLHVPHVFVDNASFLNSCELFVVSVAFSFNYMVRSTSVKSLDTAARREDQSCLTKCVLE